MPRQSGFQAYLNKLPDQKRQEMEAIARTAPSTTQALKELKRRGFRGSYDMVLSWRNMQKSARPSETVSPSSFETDSPQPDNPLREIQSLYRRANRYCNQVLDLLEGHQWLEPGEIRLSSRQAEKLFLGFPTLLKACSAGLVDMSRLETEIDKKELSLGVLFELSEDWKRALQHDNPELIPILDNVLEITKARLELNKSSALESMLESPPHELMPESNSTPEMLPEK